MFVNLDKEDLVNLVISTSPSYDDMDKFKKLGFGRYYGGFNDRWEWDRSKLSTLSEDRLLDIYSMLQGKLYEFINEPVILPDYKFDVGLLKRQLVSLGEDVSKMNISIQELTDIMGSGSGFKLKELGRKTFIFSKEK